MTVLAAERRGKLVAVVRMRHVHWRRSRQPASPPALERIYGQPVAINIEVDPGLVGGITVQIGDEVIDGSISGRLESARRRVTG